MMWKALTDLHEKEGTHTGKSFQPPVRPRNAKEKHDEGTKRQRSDIKF